MVKMEIRYNRPLVCNLMPNRKIFTLDTVLTEYTVLVVVVRRSGSFSCRSEEFVRFITKQSLCSKAVAQLETT
jgi:hypothetical protein